MTSGPRKYSIVGSGHLKDVPSILKVSMQMNAKIQMTRTYRVRAT